MKILKGIPPIDFCQIIIKRKFEFIILHTGQFGYKKIVYLLLWKGNPVNFFCKKKDGGGPYFRILGKHYF